MNEVDFSDEVNAKIMNWGGTLFIYFGPDSFITASEFEDRIYGNRNGQFLVLNNFGDAVHARNLRAISNVRMMLEDYQIEEKQREHIRTSDGSRQ